MLEQLAQLARTPEDRTMWYKQLADMISGDVQSGKSTDGDKRLHSVRCEMVPNRAESAYVGRAMGREIVYERSRKLVQADIDRVNPTTREFRRR